MNKKTLVSNANNEKNNIPPFLAINANSIEHWANQSISARTRLSVLLRTLVLSTNNNITKIDFPGNDDAQRPGWDGYIETTSPTPWIPEGRSGWEFGTNVGIKQKADSDFAKSIEAHSAEERAKITFIFVTPRRWAGKVRWIAAQQKKQVWKEVRAYDSSDLEQWLAQSLAGQTWFANETHMPATGVRSLDQCWNDWANIAEPPLPAGLFNSALAATNRTILARLTSLPDGPTFIAADSTDEALAYISQLLRNENNEVLGKLREKTIVFDESGLLPSLAESISTIIPVIPTRDVEKELAPFAKKIHSFVIYPRNQLNITPHVILEPVSHETFNLAFANIGLTRDRLTRLEHESGRSLTVLRRRLADVPAIQQPEWATNLSLSVGLVPFMFAGSWDSNCNADKSAIEKLAGDRPYETLEKSFQHYLQLNDAPVWSIGKMRGVVSKIDLLYAISAVITEQDIRCYLEVVQEVLDEDDPALDLEEEQRWMASVYGKKRQFSGAFREGISETLVLLAVHGDTLFKSRLGLNMAAAVSNLVSQLLPKPLSIRKLEANDRNLPVYAEASPQTFLSIIETDLGSNAPATLGLLKPAGPGPFSSPRRTGLLWALEGLAWAPETFSRVAIILARLAKVEINDNWANKPINSLLSIFRAWMPQTAASHEMRVAMLKRMAMRFPDIAWKICINQLDYFNRAGFYNHKPKWRNDAFGFGEPFKTRAPINAFIRETVEILLTWQGHTLAMLCDLNQHLSGFEEADQRRIWQIMEHWAICDAGDADKAVLREKIRQKVLSRRAALRAQKHPDSVALLDVAKKVYIALEPENLLNRHAWLFRENWVDESADEIENIETLDFEQRTARITKRRVEALAEIYTRQGNEGLLSMACMGNGAWEIGRIAADSIIPIDSLSGLVAQSLELALKENTPEKAHPYHKIIAGVIYAISDEEQREQVLRDAANHSEETLLQLLLLSPFTKSIWVIVETMKPANQENYWAEIVPLLLHHEEESEEAVHRLIQAKRPRAAFACIKYHPEKIDVELLYDLLQEIATGGGKDNTGQYLLDDYHIEQAFNCINTSSQFTLEQKATLEFAYLGILAPYGDTEDKAGIPSLERYIEAHPELFVQAIVWTYKRKDGQTDPEIYQLPAEQIQSMAERGHNLLEAIHYLPGHDEYGQLQTTNLEQWVNSVRQSCTELGRIETADRYIGHILASAQIGNDGIWPCEVVREVLENIQSAKMIHGMSMAKYNSRGIIGRSMDEGGLQEKTLAEQYRKWGQALLVTHPFVATNLLFDMANGYDEDASREDADVSLSRRLMH